MKQKLQFESAWDRTIADKDRKEIIEVFRNTEIKPKRISFTPLKQAINHKRELLITVLMHNSTQEDFTFNQTNLSYSKNNQVRAAATFYLPSLTIEKGTSMPWTFIFPSYQKGNNETYKDGKLFFNN